ncbi:MAG TPA: hypothetical protein VK014_08060 [Cyclobacteriaceae bacterium]|nr:hypothetical protein [Cyclobacteriaceae bacterium]
MDLKRIDTLWHFFATQNGLFLKKIVEKEVSYKMRKGDIEVRHTINPQFLTASSLCIQAHDFEMAVKQYAVAKKRFGIKVPFQKPNEGLFFPKELLRLSALYSFYVEKDRLGRLRVILEPFIPKKISEVYKPVNLVTKTLWQFNFFSETIKN